MLIPNRAISQVLKFLAIKIVGNDVKYIKITFDHNFHQKIQNFLQIFVPGVELCVKNLFWGAGRGDGKRSD